MIDTRDEEGVQCLQKQQQQPVIIKPINSSSTGRPNTSNSIDRGWAWVVLVAAFLCTVIAFGHIVNSSIYFIIFLNAYNHSRSYTSWIITIQGFVIHISGLISSLMLAKYGARVTMITGAIISSISLGVTYFADSITFVIATFATNGIGVSLMISSSVAAIALYFKKYFNVAMGISNSGAGVGIMFMGTVLELTVANYGWKGAMLFQAGLMMQVIVCGTLIFKQHKDNTKSINSESSPTSDNRGKQPAYRSFLKMCRNKKFLLVMITFFLYYFYLNIYVLIQKDIFLSKHFDSTYEVIILCFGVSNILGRALAGVIAEYLLVPSLQFCLSTIVASIAVVAMEYVQLDWVYFLLTVIFGFCVGQQAALLNLTIAFLFNRQLTPILFSFGLVMGANSYVGGTPLAGYMIDVSQSYTGTMWMISAGCLACGLMILISHFLNKKKSSIVTKESDLLNDQPMDTVKANDYYD